MGMIWVWFGALQSNTKVFISIGYLLSMYLPCIGYVLCMLYVCSAYVLRIISSCSGEDEGRGERHPLSIQRRKGAKRAMVLACYETKKTANSRTLRLAGGLISVFVSCAQFGKQEFGA